MGLRCPDTEGSTCPYRTPFQDSEGEGSASAVSPCTGEAERGRKVYPKAETDSEKGDGGSYGVSAKCSPWRGHMPWCLLMRLAETRAERTHASVSKRGARERRELAEEARLFLEQSSAAL